jgi:hypothetical protein
MTLVIGEVPTAKRCELRYGLFGQPVGSEIAFLSRAFLGDLSLSK